MRMKKNICAILACAMIFGAFSIPVAEAKEAPVMQIVLIGLTQHTTRSSNSSG